MKLVSVTLRDGDGNVIKCKCGNEASSGAIGKESCEFWCKECEPSPKYAADFVYKAPDGKTYECEWGTI